MLFIPQLYFFSHDCKCPNSYHLNIITLEYISNLQKVKDNESEVTFFYFWEKTFKSIDIIEFRSNFLLFFSKQVENILFSVISSVSLCDFKVHRTKTILNNIKRYEVIKKQIWYNTRKNYRELVWDHHQISQTFRTVFLKERGIEEDDYGVLIKKILGAS